MTTRLSGLIARPFFSVHRAVRAGKYREYWLKGGRGSGKSSYVSIEIWLGIVADPDANALIYRKTGATLRESVFEQMLWAADALGIGDRIRRKVAPLEIVYAPTGQRILFRGADDPGKSKSIKLSRGVFRYLWFEELTEFSGMEDVRSIKASVLRGEGKAVAFMSYNPPASASNWVNAEALAVRKDRLVHHSCYLDVPKKWLGKAFLKDAEALRDVNERTYRQMYLGEVTGTGAQVFENLEIRRIAPEETASGARTYCGLDFGFASDPDAFVEVALDRRRGKMWIVSEFVRGRLSAEELAREVGERMPAGTTLTCDSAEPRALQALRERGVRATAAKKGPGSVRQGMRFLQELNGIVIDPARCPVAAREFSRCEYARDREGRILPDYQDRDNHTIDAARYALERVIGAREARTFQRESIGL